MEKYRVTVSRYQVKEIYVSAPDAVSAVRLAAEMYKSNEIEFDSSRDTDFVNFETYDKNENGNVNVQMTKNIPH